MDRYTKAKHEQIKEEPSLTLVENEKHIYYAKGALNMFALQKCIGEN